MKRETLWIKEYVSYMCAKDYEAAFKLKDSYLPNSLYKYRPLNEFTLENIEGDTAWLADLNTLNDPYESISLFDYENSIRSFFKSIHFLDGFKSKFGITISSKELESIINSKNPYNAYSDFCNSKGLKLNSTPFEQSNIIQEKWEKVREETRNLIRIFSLSEEKNSLLMWSHYSSQHQGICIEYNYSNFDAYRAFLHPVNYTNELFKLKSIDELNPINLLMAAICKSSEWEYEKEWRIVALPNHQINNNCIEAPIPKAIYLGTRFNLNSSFKQKQLLRIAKSKNIPVFQMKIHPHEYKIIEDFKIE